MSSPSSSDGDGDDEVVVARGGLPADGRSASEIPALWSDGSCGTSTQRVCYRALLACGCVEACSSSPAVFRRRWRMEVSAVVVLGQKDLLGPLCNSVIF